MKWLLWISLVLSGSIYAADIIPTGNDNNILYYRIGGGADFALPPVQDTQTINLGVNGDLGSGYGCGAFNPVLSLSNSLNNLKNSVDNIEQSILDNATGSLAQMPMYFLAQANPTAYNLINNALLRAHQQLDISVKSCQTAKDQIAQGKDPYQDWATIAVGDEWKQHLSLTASGQEDINAAKQKVDQDAGNKGVPWVQGSQASDGSFHAGGLSQPPVHVIADTVKAGYNAMLLRDLNSNDPAPTGDELAKAFPTPADAQQWMTNVVGDQTVTTCNDASCKNQQDGVSGRGLLPWITSCSEQNQDYCADTMRTRLVNLITGQSAMTNDNLEAVSASGLVISPQVITAIRTMDNVQQAMIVNKLAQEIATQIVIDRALIARNLLQTGSQVPVIAGNQPAQTMIHQAITRLDKDIQSLAFESQVRKQMMSDTLSNILRYQANQQTSAAGVSKIIPPQLLMENSALPTQGNQP